MTAEWIFSWHNLIFIVPFMLALVYLGVYIMSGWTFGEADVDQDIDHDANVDHDVDSNHDGGAESHHAAHADVDHHGPPLHVEVMLWLGVGRVPVGLVLMILLLTWGAIGFLTNNLTRPLAPADWMTALASLPLAFFGSLWITRGTTRLIGRYMPLTETSARKRKELLGSVGEAIYTIDDKFGLVSLRNGHSGVFQVPCRVGVDRAIIAKGEKVLLVGYDETDGLFTVIPYELGDAAARAAMPIQSESTEPAPVQKVRES
jgi:hypothetical protein